MTLVALVARVIVGDCDAVCLWIDGVGDGEADVRDIRAIATR